jgi:hypothetical protein
MNNAKWHPTPFAKVFFILVALLIVWFSGRPLVRHLFPQAATKPSAVPGKVDLPPIVEASGGSTYDTSTAVQGNSGTPLRYLGYAWNAQMGLMYANGTRPCLRQRRVKPCRVQHDRGGPRTEPSRRDRHQIGGLT